MAMFQRKRKATYKKKPYSKRTKRTKKTYKSSSRGYKKMSTSAKPKRMGSTHWLSYGVPGYFKGVNNSNLKKDLNGQAFKAYNTNVTGSMTCTAGRQGFGLICGVYDSDDITAVNGGSRAKHFLKSAVVKIAMSNQANASCFVDIYDLQCRNDNAGIADPTNPVYADNTQLQYYGTSLFQFQDFTETFKINRVTSLNLAAGETAEHRMSIKPEHLFKDNELSTNSFKGLTRFIVYLIRGPASDDSLETTVGTLPTKVNFIASKEYRIQQVTNINNTFTTGAVVSTTSVRVMELDGDETNFITA